MCFQLIETQGGRVESWMLERPLGKKKGIRLDALSP
jgi:hypothetical protein